MTHLTSAIGAVIEKYRYDAFGAPTIYDSLNTQLSTSNYGNRFLFTGREYASTFGIYEYRARAYHPTLGRFMSEDPKGFVHRMEYGATSPNWSLSAHPGEGEFNLFRYCGNDPLDFTDPMGLDPQTVDPPVDYLAAYGAIQTLKTSEGNLDRRGAGLERLVVIYRDSSGLHQSGMAVGQPKPDGGQTTTFPPHEGVGEAAAHNHTNDIRTSGTIFSPADRREVADVAGKPIYVAARDSRTGKIIVERYRPSDSAANREQHKDSATEALKPKAVDQLEKSNGKQMDLDRQWKKLGVN